MRWINFFHIYQPPEWNAEIVRRVSVQAYRPLVDILQRHPEIKITLNLTGSLTEQLAALGMEDVLLGLKELLERGQIELVGSAMYHPILPLLPTDEVRRQIHLQHELHRRVFGDAYQPKGFYPPEMAFAPWLEPLLLELGYEWVILDEIAATGVVGSVDFQRRYTTASGLGVVLRNRPMSDFLSFRASVDRGAEAWKTLSDDPRSHTELVTAMDGENLGHHRAGVERLWETLVTHPQTTSSTISEYRASLSTESVLTIHPSSWSSQERELSGDVPFGLWNHPSNPVHKLQWQLTHAVIAGVRRGVNDPNWAAARLLLDQALTSDKYWWASASPWWDLTIVLRESQRIADVIRPLASLPADDRGVVAGLMEKLATEATWWDKSGLAKRRQTGYLEETGAVHYMAGAQV